MKEQRFFYVPQAACTHELPSDEAVHAVRVLRLSAGDDIYLMDGEGCFYQAVITLATKSKCLYDIQQTMPQTKTWSGAIHLAIAPTKLNERTEWMLEKATEVGFDEVSFLNCDFSERHAIKTERFERIVVSAMKQSRKGWKPRVKDIVAFKKWVETPREGLKFIAHCYDDVEKKDLFSLLTEADKTEDVTVMIGPEGDFSREEVALAEAHGFVSVTLGESRLRTETAGLSAVMMAQLTKRR